MSFGGHWQQWGGEQPDHDRSRALLVRLLPFAAMLLFGVVSLARGCQRGPFGRAQSVGMSPQQEAQLGLAAAAQIRQQEPPLPRGDPRVAGVAAVAKRLHVAAAHPQVLARLQIAASDFEWETDVIPKNQLNAFCLPGGKVFVYTGILAVCENQGGLACVMGHEIAHALAHHGAERAAHQNFVSRVGTGFGLSVGGMDPNAQRTAMAVFSAGAKFGGLLPFSRKHESEADRMGLTLMAAAGFDPREAPRFWLRMAEQAGGGRGGEWMSTHPSHGTRIRDLESWMPEAMEVYDAYGRAGGDAAEIAGRTEAAADALRELREIERRMPVRPRAVPQPEGRPRPPGGQRPPPPLG